ncbi:MAG: sugar phosphate isomerase/epimerase [Marinifilum sp.]|jgi:hypothetical protein|nr:sugar phosphate isomerase/epimerase [Marinifilum sp.]
MNYQNLIDFSADLSDVERFENKWEGLKEYIAQQELDGIELLIKYNYPSAEIPKEIVKSIHLPFWITWLDVWRKGESAAKYYFSEMMPEYLQFFCGGRNAAEMVETQKRLWKYASVFNPAHAVVHASHVELDHMFTRDFTYKNTEVCSVLAQLLNRTAQEFTDGEPPVTLAIENLWWPGLDLLFPAEVDDFAGSLEFDNWNFLLDTGHLMNTNPALRCEDEAIDFILDRITRLSKGAQSRINSLHLNCSLSGEYQLQQLQNGLPKDWEKFTDLEKYPAVRKHIAQIDQHLPFTTKRVKEIIAEVQPEIVVHEFITENMDEYSEKLEIQRNNLM